MHTFRFYICISDSSKNLPHSFRNHSQAFKIHEINLLIIGLHNHPVFIRPLF